MKPSHEYSVEDWLVHAAFGMGQITGIEEKGISGENVQYFRIQTADSTYWIPVDRMDNQDLRPVSSTAEIQVIIAILLGPPQAMATKHQIRKNDIQRVLLLNSPADSARLIRDLRARQRERGELNMDELNAMRALKQRLVEEWVFVTGEHAEQVDAKIDDLLNAYHPPAEND
jgi:RNA polymerase-interacting CarD/CdnL/TRCF family regulator